MATNFFNDPTTVSVLLILLGLVAANMLTKGLLRALIMVKVFKRGNTLVQCGHDLEDYFVVGQWEDKTLQFMTRKRTDNPKPKRILTIDPQLKHLVRFRVFGVDCVLFDDVKNSLYVRRNASYESIGGYNAEAMAEKLDTALKKPPEDELGLMSMRSFMILTIIGFLLMVVGFYVLYQQGKTLDSHQKLLYDAVISSMQSMNVTG